MYTDTAVDLCYRQTTDRTAMTLYCIVL